MFYLTLASTLLLFILLPVSLLDLGVLSLWITPPMAIFTMGYHIATLVIARRKRTPGHTSYFSTVVLFAFVLGIGWFVAFLGTAVIAGQWKGDYTIEKLRKKGLATTVDAQRLQIVFTLIELALVLAIGIRGFKLASKEGHTPDSWRPVTPGQESVPGLAGREEMPPVSLPNQHKAVDLEQGVPGHKRAGSSSSSNSSRSTAVESYYSGEDDKGEDDPYYGEEGPDPFAPPPPRVSLHVVNTSIPTIEVISPDRRSK
jgi:hypothetical protein